MKKALIYSVCGCFLTSAATALTFYVDTGENSKCAGTGFCLVNPGDGNCCSAQYTITKFNAGEIADDKVFDGLKIAGVTIAGADGTPVDLKGKSSEELKAMKSAATSSGTAARVTKQLYDKAAGANEDNLNVVLDLAGGKLAGDTEEKDSVSVALDKGASLSDYTPETRGGDGLEFAGWTTGTGKTVTSVEGEKGQTVIYTATYKCPDGKELINGTCFNVENVGGEKVITDEIIDRGGNPVNPTQGHTCWRDTDGNGTYDANYCYWKVNITFHDKPTTGASDINVYYNTNKSNNGKTLNCDGGCYTSTTDKWCYEYDELRPEMCTRINMPRANGYKFRGYYYNVPNDIITQTSTTNSGAYNNFFPKNLNANDISITGHTVVVMNDTPVSTSASINIDVYGGWARDCATDSELNPAGCLMRLGQTYETNSYGLGKGDVRYDTECVGGKHLVDGTDGTYNPQCEDDTGDITFTYVFHNQYGETINCSSITPSSCTTGNKISLVSQSNFNAACGNQYTLRYLNIKNEWYRPSYQAGCNTNVFGQSGNVTIEGYACETCKADTVPEHGHCENMEATTQINYNPINPDLYGVGSSGYSVGYGGLWGADPSGSNAYPACTKIVCDTGYQLWTDNTGVKSCVTDYQACINAGKDNCDAIGFSCPSSGYAPAANSNVTISAPSKSGTSCSYTIGCSAGVPEWDTGVTASGTVVTCSGSQCTSSWVQNQLNGKSCFKCLTTGFAYDTSLTVGQPTLAPTYAATSHSCTYRVWCRTGNYANQEPVGTVTCYSNNNNGQTPCRTPVGTTYYYNITNLINAYVDDCSGATSPVLDSCPTISGNTGGPESNPSSWGAVNVTMTGTPANGCTYTVSCANSSYTLVEQSEGSYITVPNGTTTVTCSGSNCTTGSLSTQIGSYYCRKDMSAAS